MADKVTVENLPDSGSPQRVAMQLFNIIWHSEGQPADRKAVLDLYAECLDATRGHRAI